MKSKLQQVISYNSILYKYKSMRLFGSGFAPHLCNDHHIKMLPSEYWVKINFCLLRNKQYNYGRHKERLKQIVYHRNFPTEYINSTITSK